MKRSALILPALALLCASLAGFTNHAAADDLPGLGVQPASYFYTGKPYDEDLGVYVFAYRNYDSALSRWTTIDPSGFPDGANNLVYSSIPTCSLDAEGLLVHMLYSISTKTLRAYDERNPGLEYIFSPMFSGDNNPKHQKMASIGPIPVGNWKIYTRDRGAAWHGGYSGYILDAQDKTPLDDHEGFSGANRSAMRIHWGVGGGATAGCIVGYGQGFVDASLLLDNTVRGGKYTIDTWVDEDYLGVLKVVE